MPLEEILLFLPVVKSRGKENFLIRFDFEYVRKNLSETSLKIFENKT